MTFSRTLTSLDRSALCFGMASSDESVCQAASPDPGPSPCPEQRSDLTALALAARTGETQAMRRFVTALAPSVRNVCRGVLGYGHVELEDTVQECLIEILRALPKYRMESEVVHYTRRIALRHSIAARKRSRNRERRVRALEALLPSTFPSSSGDSLPDLWFLRDLIDELPDVQAEAVLMRMVFGYSLEEMALATQVSVNTCKSRLRAAKDYLRVRMDQEAHVAVRWREP